MRIFEYKSATNKLLLMQRFHEYKMSLRDTVVQHIAKVQNMAAQLIDVDETVTQVTIMAKILANLSVKYSLEQCSSRATDY